MSRSALALDSDAALSSKSRSSGLRVNKPGDSYEVEADRVAETVSSGGKLNGSNDWSISKLNMSHVQRDSTSVPGPPQSPSPGPKPNNYEEGLGKLGEAFLKTDLGKQLTDAAKKQPIVKDAEDFASTLPGKIIIGAAATSAVTALAATHTPLPLQIPAIPLDSVRPGLSVKITYEGPVDHPTKATISFSYTPKASNEDKKKSKQSATDRQRAENARNANDLYNFREGLKSPEQRRAEDEDAQHALNSWVTRPNALTGGIDPNKYIPGGAPAKPTGPQLTAPPLQSPYERKIPSLLDKKLELKPMTDSAADAKKKEDIPVQRKAQPNAEVFADSAEVESVVRSSGRPLDAETRRYMESRIGFDFSKVRVHTDARADASAKSLGARAYTVGNSVVFGAGTYAPHTSAGRRLLAHELTHVVQQTAPVHRPHPVVRPAPRQVQRFAGLDLLPNFLLDKLRNMKVYPLICVAMAQDLITDKPVERTPATLIKAVLGLFEDGPALYEKLVKAGDALKKAYDWVLAQFVELKLTVSDFSELLTRVKDSVNWHLSDSWDRVKAILEEPYKNFIELAKRLGKAALNLILEGALAVFGDTGRKVYAFFKKAGNVLGRIAADPLKFAKNLFAVVQLGFKNFAHNILDHLGEGVKTWIFEELQIKGVTIPKEFTFASMLKLFLQVLGLTYEQRRDQLVLKLTEPVVYFFETTGKVLDRVRKEGFSAIWDEIKKGAESIFDSLLGSIKDWIVKEIVKQAVIIVASLANPVGELIEAVRSIYETVEFIIEKAAKLADLISTVLDALSDIVDGVIAPAAQKVEDSLAKTIPLILRFLAGLLHLSGIGKSIRELVDKIRDPIDKIIGLVLDKIVAVAKPLWDKAKDSFMGQLTALKEWWKKPRKFDYGEEQHELSIEGEGDSPQVFVHSDKKPLDAFLDEVHATAAQRKKILALAKGLKWKKGELQKPSDDEKGNKEYDKLVEEMARLKAKNPPKADPPKYGGTTALGGGQWAEAFLSPNHEEGSRPDQSEPPIWADLGYLLPKPQKFYVRGHLLSQKLGGQGDWNNLMPITNTVNSRMNAWVEKPLKNATAKGTGRRFYWYRVEATYKDIDIGPEVPKREKAANKARADLAEQRLVSLKWTTTPATYDKDQGWKKASGPLLDEKGDAMPTSPKSVAKDDFTPPTVRD